MLRSILLACVCIHCTALCGSAGEPNLIFVIVPEPGLAAEITDRFPGIGVGVLQDHANEADELLNARAVAMRNATHLVFDPCSETMRLAMFRERLQMQGVVAINLRQFAQSGYKIKLPAGLQHHEQHATRLPSLQVLSP